MIKHKQTAVILLTLFLLTISHITVSASDTKTDFFTERSGKTVALPYKEEMTFSHKAAETEHNILDRRTISFRVKRDGVVSILFSSGAFISNGIESRNTVTASVYSDEGIKICENQTDDSSSTAHIEFVSAYGGVYFLVLESRATTPGEYPCSFSLSASTDYDKITISSFPHKSDYRENTHSSVSFSELFSNTKYEAAESYKVSVFEFSHEAGSVFSYKLNTEPGALFPYAVCMTYDGNVYTPHFSHNGNQYTCGDAVELSYSAQSYLFVFSDGNFSLEADILLHNEYKTVELGQAFSGKLNTSDAPLMYDEEKIAAITADFPFSNIKNRNVIFFSFNCLPGSVVSYICDRGEDKFFSLVSDESGLSHSSDYPMRLFGEYSSELSTGEYFYSAYANDGEKFYLCYTGTGTEAYIEVQSTLTHTTAFVPEQKYKPGDILQNITVQNIYSDEEIYKKLGIEKDSPDLIRIGGYMMVDEDGERFYFAHDDSIIIPNVDGKIKLYATVDCVYNSNSDNSTVEHRSILIAEIVSDRGFLKPIIENIVEYVKDNPLIKVIIGGVLVLGIVAASFSVVFFVRKKKAKIKDESKDTNPCEGGITEDTNQSKTEDGNE